MTRISQAASRFRLGTDGAGPIQNTTTAFGTYVIVPGDPCKVCEANTFLSQAIRPTFEPLPLGGSFVMTCEVVREAGSVSHHITLEATVKSVSTKNDATQASLLSLGVADVFDVTSPRTADEEYANTPWPSAMPWGSSNNPASKLIFVEQTTSSSIEPGATYVATSDVGNAFISYAGNGQFAAGYQPAVSSLPYQVVMYATDQFGADSKYLDAKPFHATVATVATSADKVGAAGFTTRNVTLAGQSFRIGRVDLPASGYRNAAPPDRTLQPCDYNLLTLNQRKCERHIFRDSPFFKYGTAVEIETFERPPIQHSATANATLTSAEQLQAQESKVNLFPFGEFTLGNSRPISLGINTTHPLRLSSGALKCTHALPDGRKTLPGEWHYFGASGIPNNEIFTAFAFKGQELSLNPAEFLLSLVDYAPGDPRLLLAKQSADALVSDLPSKPFFSGSFFGIESKTTQKFLRTQLRVQIDSTTSSQSGAIIRLAYRCTALCDVEITRYAAEFVSAESQQIPPFWSFNPLFGNMFSGPPLPGQEVFWSYRVAGKYRFPGTGTQSPKRTYLLEFYGSDTLSLAASEWRDQAMQGQQVRKISSTLGADIGIRLVDE